MARTAGKRAREEQDSDGGFISHDEGSAPKKKTKKGQATKPKAAGGDEKYWELSSGKAPRRVGITNFKQSTLINIREYYEKDDEFLPGKKGISLNIDQYKALLKAIPEINAELKAQGIDVTGEDKDEEEDVDAMEEDDKPKKRIRAKKDTKANIEATSDEDEED